MIRAQQRQLVQDRQRLQRLYYLKHRRLSEAKRRMMRALHQMTRRGIEERFCIMQSQTVQHLARCRMPFNPLIMRIAHTSG